MKASFILLILSIFFACSFSFSSENKEKELSEFDLAAIFSIEDPALRIESLKKLYDKSDEYIKFILLSMMGRASFELGNFNDAALYSNELLELANKYKSDWNYGNAIHDANMMLGMVALAKNDINLAKSFLIKASKTTGSPQINSFGPNLMLAKALIERNEYETAIKYFEALRQVWSQDNGRLTSWIESLKAGAKPYLEMHVR